jgi:hypothetical protein
MIRGFVSPTYADTTSRTRGGLAGVVRGRTGTCGSTAVKENLGSVGETGAEGTDRPHARSLVAVAALTRPGEDHDVVRRAISAE